MYNRIGWAHGDTRVVDINVYEDARPYRRQLAFLVLNRQRREELLQYWQIPIPEIVDAIRSNLKAKNQRRQTITNLGKVEKIEEAFENATKKLKRVLLPKRRSDGDKVKDFPPVYTPMGSPSNYVPTNYGALKINDRRALTETRDRGVSKEHTADVDDLPQNTPGSTFWRIAERDPDTRAPMQIVVDDDGMSTVSGFTVGNSTTASALEMEKFYRELEQEMFGNRQGPSMGVPSMVGQTLEVPDGDYPIDSPIQTGPIPLRLHQIHHFPEYAAIYGSPAYAVAPPTLPSHPPMQHYVQSPLPQQTNHFNGGAAAFNPTYLSQSYEGNLSRSLESLDLGHSSHSNKNKARVRTGQTQHMTPPLHPFLPTTGSPNHQGMAHIHPPLHRDAVEGPAVRHAPLQSHISPSKWMDDSDVSADDRLNEPVIISEDQYDDDQLILFGGQQFVSYGYSQEFPPNGHFPPNQHLR